MEDEPDHEELRLAPSDPVADSNRQMIMEVHLPVSPLVTETEQPRWQFRVWDLIIVTTVVAFTCSLNQWFPLRTLAALIGLVTLLILILMRVLQIRSRAFEIVFWGSMMLYLAYALVAAFFE